MFQCEQNVTSTSDFRFLFFSKNKSEKCFHATHERQREREEQKKAKTVIQPR